MTDFIIKDNNKEFEKFCSFCFTAIKKWDIKGRENYNFNHYFTNFMFIALMLYVKEPNKDKIQSFIKEVSLFDKINDNFKASDNKMISGIDGIMRILSIITDYDNLDVYDLINYIFIYNISLVNYKDLLDMEKAIYDKILEPYPKDFKNMHDKCSKIMLVKQEEISQKLFEKRYKELKDYEVTKETKGYSNSKYYVFAPKTKDDMLIEAIAQSNCLASYAKKYALGETNIFFMRKKDSPDKSLVTIEVRDGQIRQALRAHNKNISPEELEFVRKWAKNNNIIVPRNISTALCA